MTSPLTMKAWVLAEAQKRGVTPKTIYRRRALGLYDQAIEIQRHNARVVFVISKAEPKPFKKRGWTGLSLVELGRNEYHRRLYRLHHPKIKWRKLMPQP